MRGLFFDIGGVVIHDRGLKARALQAFPGVDADRFWQLANTHTLAACRGEESLAEAWRAVAAALGVSISDEVAHSLWIDDFRAAIEIDVEVRKIISELAGTVKLGVISNTVDPHAKILREMGVYDGFETLVLSHEIKMTKDGPEIFEVALSRMGLPAEEVGFIDDIEQWVTVARGLGMNGFHFQGAEKLRRELEGAGVLRGA